MLKREREIRRMVADLGMEITSWRTNGSGHWRVDIRTPNGRQRPFTFSTDQGDIRLRKNEETALRRWRREVQPELDMAEEAGALEPPPSARTALAEKLAKAGIPLKVENPMAIGHKVLRVDDKPRTEPPFRKVTTIGAPDTPEAALARSLGVQTPAPTPTPAPAPKEPAMQTTASPPPPEPHKKYTHTKKREQMSFAEVMKFGAWMAPEKLEGYYTRTDFCDHATKTLGFKVSDSVLLAWLEEHNVQMPTRPQPPQAKKNWHEQVNDDLATIALTICETIPDGPHRTLLLAIVERRTAANHPKA